MESSLENSEEREKETDVFFLECFFIFFQFSDNVGRATEKRSA